MSAPGLREEGNKHFKCGEYDEAIRCYSDALSLTSLSDSDRSVILKNRAACNLKQDDFDAVIKDATQALELAPNDPKALFRRCQAHEKLGHVEEAYCDAAILVKLEPKDKDIANIFRRLTPVIQQKVKQQNSTESKVSQMFKLAFLKTEDKEKRLQALSNLLVLAREQGSTRMMVKASGITYLSNVLQEVDVKLIQAALRVLSCLCDTYAPCAMLVYNEVTLFRLCVMLGHFDEDVCITAGSVLQAIINKVAGLEEHKELIRQCEEMKRKGERCRFPDIKIEPEGQATLDEIFPALIKMLVHAKVSGCGRDAAMELLIRNITWKDGVAWTSKFLSTDGIQNLLTVAGALKTEKTLQTTAQSRMHAAMALSRIYDDLSSDSQREKFKEECRTFFMDLFNDSHLDSKVEAINAISTLLQGPFEVGNMMLGLQGVLEMMIAMASSENKVYRRIAVEAIVHSASKKDKCTGILKDAVPILKSLYQSGDDHIRVRALVGLCKLGSFSGTDASCRPMADGSTLTLAKACRKFLSNPSKDIDLRRWATEGLAFLTLDAEVKEALCNDSAALASLIDLTKNSDKLLMYAASSVFVNVGNCYDKADVMPELKELAKFSKQHVPEDHAMDAMVYVQRRLHQLAAAGVVTALVTFTSIADSKNTREQIARVFIGLATEEGLRGTIVQQGGAKALIPLTHENSDVGRILAAHALAKISVTMNPVNAFPGQRMLEIVRPILQLLALERSGLQNFEALMALTNLASVSESVRKRILSEKGVGQIEHYMYEEHDEIKRAATECMCNMIMSEEVQKLFKGETDRVKLWVLYCGEDDLLLVRAASGGLAILSTDLEICEKIIKVQDWAEILITMSVCENMQVRHRGIHIVKNLMAASKDIAQAIVQTQLLELIMALTKLDGPEDSEVKHCAEEALASGVEFSLIEAVGKGDDVAGEKAHAQEMVQRIQQVIAEAKEAARKEKEEAEKDEAEEEEKKVDDIDSLKMMPRIREFNKEEDEELELEGIVPPKEEGDESLDESTPVDESKDEQNEAQKDDEKKDMPEDDTTTESVNTDSQDEKKS